MPNLQLFPEPQSVLATKLRDLARRDVWVGTSSWTYGGWLGKIYTPESYQTRGRFSKKKFQDTCLAEYAETFPIVCGDFSFYQFPSDAYWQRLFHSAPETLRFGFKAPEEITIRRFPTHARYGARRGQVNENLLDAELFSSSFLRPLEPFREQVAVIIFEFGVFSKRSYEGPAEFAADLEEFLAQLPPSHRYSVEIRNPEFLTDEYFDCLRRHRVAHVFNAGTRMPELAMQIQIPEAFTSTFTVTRALLRAGRNYEQAVKQFSPYKTIQDANPEARVSIHSLIERAAVPGRAAYIFVNNRFEGNAPATIEAIIDEG